MAFDLSTPAAKLAFEMALKNRKTVENAGQVDAEGQAAVAKALEVGNDPFGPYEPIYQEYVGPVEAQRRAQAEAFNTYLVGLPELLAKAAQEDRSTGGGSQATYSMSDLSNYESPADRLARLYNNIIAPVAAPAQQTQTPRKPAQSNRRYGAIGVRKL